MSKSLLLFLAIVIFLAGCTTPPSDPTLKNDVIAIENYFVSSVSPYENTPVILQFDIVNNGDQSTPYSEVEFFDVPGFSINSLKCEPSHVSRSGVNNKCFFDGNAFLEPLDRRTITVGLTPNEQISSPTPHTVSIAVRYVYFGSRDVSIPVIDGQTRTKPLSSFRENEPSVGPVVLNIDPSLERSVQVGDKTIHENWAVGGSTPLPFLVRFEFKHIGSLKERILDINVSDLRLDLGGLSAEGICDFCIPSEGCNHPIEFYVPDLSAGYFQNINVLKDMLDDYDHFSKKSVRIPTESLICTFKPVPSPQPEYSATISAMFAYKYEIIKTQDFVIQPLP